MTVLLPTYKRFDLQVAQASGTTVKDTEGKTYLDFGSGIGVCNLGHRHPAVQKAIEAQLNKYWHVSNLYHQPIQEEVAQMLIENSCGDHVFFCNSGAEANEAALKLARKATGKRKVITFLQSFHGRTFGTMAATGQDKIKQGFGPVLETFEYVPYNDISAVKEAVDGDTAAVMLEVIQGEGGVIPAEQTFLKELEQLCEQEGILLIVDEVQTGVGRTGKAFGHSHYGISPDIISVAKGLGNGVPVGAIIASSSLYEHFGPGSHGTTFGGNPIAMAAAKAVLENVFQDEFLEDVTKKGQYLQDELKRKVAHLPVVDYIRGKGLMIGIVCNGDVSSIINLLISKGLLVLGAGESVIRLLPPLTVSKEEMNEAVTILESVLRDVS